MADHTHQAHTYIRTEAELSAMKSFLETLDPGSDDMGVRVEWSRASACTGYKEMQLAVQRLVAPQMRSLMAKAYAQAFADRNAALAQLQADLTHGS